VPVEEKLFNPQGKDIGMPTNVRSVLGRVTLVSALTALVAVSVFSGFNAKQASAQDATPTATDDEWSATVSTSGQGIVTIQPDTASVVVGVNIIDKTLSEAQAKATTQMEAVIAALKEAGIAERDIQTVNYSVNILQNYDSNGNPATIEGFQVSNQVNVTIRDLTKLGSILDTVVGKGANAIYGISFNVNDPSAAASQARALAVADAKKKADELAAAAGMTVGRVLSISESYSPPPMPYIGGRAESADMASSVPIQAGTSAIQVDVQVVYELV
jgi:uncharacterized protein